MRVPRIRLRTAVSLSAIGLCLVYLLLVFNVTIVLVQNDELEPSLAGDTFVFLSHEPLTQAGDIIAIEQSGTLELRRVFALGPVIAHCIKDTGFLGGEMVRFSISDSHWSSAEAVGEVSERWGLVSIPIRRNMKLISQGVTPQRTPTVVPEGSFLVGCQNRIRCGGCGFRSVTQAEVFGRMSPDGLIYNWLSQAGTFWRSL